jgi:hypothetical protein
MFVSIKLEKKIHRIEQSHTTPRNDTNPMPIVGIHYSVALSAASRHSLSVVSKDAESIR